MAYDNFNLLPENESTGGEIPVIIQKKGGQRPKNPPFGMPLPVQLPAESSSPSVEHTNKFPLDLDKLRLPQNYGDGFGVKKLVTRIPVRKPIKTDFFRVQSGEEWRFQTMILELKGEGETYLVLPEVWDTIAELIRPAVFHVGIDRRNNVFLIPIPLSGEDGRRNSWHQSLAEAVSMAEKQWVRIASNKNVGGYDVFVSQADLPSPSWPEMSMDEMLKIAFRHNLITSLEHPVVRQLLGSA